MLFIMKLRGGSLLWKQRGPLFEYFLFIKSLYLDYKRNIGWGKGISIICNPGVGRGYVDYLSDRLLLMLFAKS